MVGRAAYHQPSDILSTADRRIYGTGTDTSAEQAVAGMLPYIEAHLTDGGACIRSPAICWACLRAAPVRVAGGGRCPREHIVTGRGRNWWNKR